MALLTYFPVKCSIILTEIVSHWFTFNFFQEYLEVDTHGMIKRIYRFKLCINTVACPVKLVLPVFVRSVLS